MPWRPAHESHAIERMSVTLQFAEPISPRPWQELIAAATLAMPTRGFNVTVEEAEVSLPAMFGVPQAGGPGVPQQMFVGFNGALPPGMRASQSPPSRTFQKLDGADVVELVSIRRAHFVYMTPHYSSWSQLKLRLAEVLGAELVQTLRLNMLGVVKLEYWDRFIYEGDPAVGMYAELFRAGSVHVAGFAKSRKELWHSHVGYFLPADRAATRLVNVNVDLLDLAEPTPVDAPPVPASPRRSAGIYSLVQDTYIPTAGAASPGDWPQTVAALDGMHDMSKLVMQDVITDDMAQRISLNETKVEP